MMKRNLYEIFSNLPAEKQKLPTLQNQTTISADAVQKRVLEKLGKTSKPKRRSIRFRRIAAALTAAVVLTSGTLLTVTAANGNLKQLLQTIFGEEQTYEYTENYLYSVPEIELTGQNDMFTVSLMGIFGDTETAFAVLKLQGQNNFTFDFEKYQFRIISTELQCNKKTEPDIDEFYSNFTKGTLHIDQNNEQIAYYIVQCNFENKKYDVLYISFGDILKRDADCYHHTALQRWLGYSVAEQNQSENRSFTTEELQKLQTTFVMYGENEAYRKEDVLSLGSIEVKIPLEYPSTEPIKKQLADDVTMTFSSWGIHLSWQNCDSEPYFINTYDAIKENVSGHIIDTDHSVTLPDGTEVAYNTFIRTKSEIYPCFSGWTEWQRNATSGEIWMTLLYPIDPTEITEVWYHGKQVYQK
ncbi:MAG: hypothetical protein ACI4TG_09815 [Ruminococcus sp.]